MIYTHTIGRIGKDCQVITGTHGTFMAVDIAVDDYSRIPNQGQAHSRGGNYLHITVERPTRREPHANLNQCGQHRFRERWEERGAERRPEEGCQERG